MMNWWRLTRIRTVFVHAPSVMISYRFIKINNDCVGIFSKREKKRNQISDKGLDLQQLFNDSRSSTFCRYLCSFCRFSRRICWKFSSSSCRWFFFYFSCQCSFSHSIGFCSPPVRVHLSTFLFLKSVTVFSSSVCQTQIWMISHFQIAFYLLTGDLFSNETNRHGHEAHKREKEERTDERTDERQGGL